MTNLDQHFGAMARRLRGERTQADVCEAAKAAGHRLHHSVLSQLESGKRRWNTAYIDAVAAGLGADPSVFLAEPTGPMARLERLAGEVIDALAELVRPAAIG